MGFIRGGIVFILAIALFFGLFVGNLFLALNWSLKYNHVSPYIQNLSNDFATSSGNKGTILGNYESQKYLCQNENASPIEFTLDEEKIVVPCETVNEGGKSVIGYLINESIPFYYYKDYNCSLIDCIKTEKAPFALVSKTAKDYWKEKFYSTLLISLIIFALIFLFIKEKHSSFILAGIISIFSAIPFRQISWLLSLLPDLLPFRILPIFFTEAGNVFILMLIIGIALISIGIGIKFFNWGMKLNEFIRKAFKKKDKKQEEEITKENLKNLIDKEIESTVNKKEKTKKEKSTSKKSKKN